MARPYAFSEREAQMHSRLDNWGKAMRGGYPGPLIPDEGRAEPNLLDAHKIEKGMCALKAEKRVHFKLLKYLYVRERGTVEAGNYFRKSDWWIRARLREGIAFLLRRCEPID